MLRIVYLKSSGASQYDVVELMEFLQNVPSFHLILNLRLLNIFIGEMCCTFCLLSLSF